MDDNEDLDTQAAQAQDLEEMAREARDAIVKGHSLGLSETECMAIAYMAGVANDVYKELRK